MQIFLPLLIAVMATCSAAWLIRKMLRSRAPAEPADEPFAEVPVPGKFNPRGRAGAVALQEPDGNDDFELSRRAAYERRN